MAEPSEKEISNVLDYLGHLNERMRFEMICKWNETQKAEYKRLLDEFERLNKTCIKEAETPDNLNYQKGLALEKLVRYLLGISGGIFETRCNLHTSTNEIDELVTLTPKGKVLLKHGLINKHLDIFLGECKNYHKCVDVTYVGKFCSLLLTNNVKLGILFSYHGVSGSGWNHAAGLIKKFYLHKEKLEERYCIIDFSIKEFKAILSGKNLLGIIEERLLSLQFDTDFTRYLSKHPAQ